MHHTLNRLIKQLTCTLQTTICRSLPLSKLHGLYVGPMVGECCLIRMRTTSGCTNLMPINGGSFVIVDLLTRKDAVDLPGSRLA